MRLFVAHALTSAGMDSLGAFEQLLLFAVLRLGNDAYGVPIRETIEERTGRSVSSGAIYTGLVRLEDRGLVSSRVGDPTPGRTGRPPRYYRLERDGARALLDAYSGLQMMAGGVVSELTALAGGGP
jgi:PadR family transcriptional regulator